jgi:hypothetical protein
MKWSLLDPVASLLVSGAVVVALVATFAATLLAYEGLKLVGKAWGKK